MAWLAIGACTLIAGYALYTFVARSGRVFDNKVQTKASSTTTHKETTASALRSILELQADEAVRQNGHPVTPTFSVAAPTLEVESERPKSPAIGVPEQTSIKTPEKAAGMMPPPQRPSSPPRLKPPTFGAMPAPPRPANGTVRPPPSAASSLRVPQTKVLSNTSMAPSSLGVPKKQGSRQVTLKPGHSPLDWAALTSNPNSRMRGKDAPAQFIRVKPSQLKQQNGRKGKDAWTVYQGKVYNITPYVPFHPGGEGEIMRGAGKDSAKLFMEVHPWVNWDGMLAECMVGILVSEEDAESQLGNSGGLDEMD